MRIGNYKVLPSFRAWGSTFCSRYINFQGPVKEALVPGTPCRQSGVHLSSCVPQSYSGKVGEVLLLAHNSTSGAKPRGQPLGSLVSHEPFLSTAGLSLPRPQAGTAPLGKSNKLMAVRDRELGGRCELQQWGGTICFRAEHRATKRGGFAPWQIFLCMFSFSFHPWELLTENSHTHPPSSHPRYPFPKNSLTTNS